VHNVAIVCANGVACSPPTCPSGAICDTSPHDTPIVKTKTLALTKTATVKKIEYHFVITNTGNATLDDVKLSDALVGYQNVTCGVTQLAPTVTTDCTATHDVVAGDIDANGNVINHATATATGVATDPTA